MVLRYWLLPGFTGLYRVLLGFPGFFFYWMFIWVLYRVFTRLYWVLLTFTGIYWLVPGFTGFTCFSTGSYRVFTRLYWVILGFTGFYWI